jgi:hypothetical protein
MSVASRTVGSFEGEGEGDGMDLIRVAAPLLLAGDVAALGAVGTIVRRRTRAVRRGTLAGPRPSWGERRTSRTTHLAWAGGAAAGLWAVSLGGIAAPALGAAAAFVAATGVAHRVIRLDVAPDGLTVHYAARAARCVHWDRCRSLRPPRGPLGAWRIDAGDVVATLMPSDLLGNEPVLAEVTRRAGLAFGRGAWRRPDPAGVSRRR